MSLVYCFFGRQCMCCKQWEAAGWRAPSVDSVDGFDTGRTWSGPSSKFAVTLCRVESVCGRTVLGPHRAVRMCRLSSRGACVHADGNYRQRWISAQVHRTGHHARRIQLRLLQQRREEIPQAQQGSLLRGRLTFTPVLELNKALFSEVD